LPAIIDWQDEVVRHGLKCRVKYVRLIKRKATSLHSRGADHWGFRYYAQLILEGQPYLKPKNQPGSLTIGLDIGPQTIAIVSQQGEVARLEQFCSELEPKAARKRRLQRKLDRQRRAGNPANFDEKGRVKKKAEGGGKLSWQESQGYKQTRRKLANADRSVAAQRKSLHGRLANEIARDSNIILTEKLSYKAFQKQYGRSVGLRAPGRFIEKMRRTVERTAGTCLEFPTRTTRLSQVCHHCGTLAKKKLSQRWHKCECGIGPIQRDVYSAWLASHVSPIEQTLSSAQCLAHWERAEPRLVAALDSLYQQAKEGKTFPRSVGLSTRARAC
jgi:hypothetical protein